MFKVVLSGLRSRLRYLERRAAAWFNMDDKAQSPGAGFFARAYGKFVAGTEYLQSPLLLAIRLFWGWQFHVTGAGKLKTLDHVADYFQTLHIPLPHLYAWIVGLSECLGGLLLLLGLGARAVAALLAFDMIVAYLTADLDKVTHIFQDPDKFTAAAPFLFLLACSMIVAFGPGAFSLDGLIKRRRRNVSDS
jgi:putative oxidoreductase